MPTMLENHYTMEMLIHKMLYSIEVDTNLYKPPKPKAPNDAPVIMLVDKIIKQAIDAHASDIHIEPTAEIVRIRFRIDGQLREMHELPISVHAFLVSRLKIMSSLDIIETRMPQDGRIHYEHGKKTIDLRISTMPVMYGEKVVIRILDKSASLLQTSELGFSPSNFKLFTDLCHSSYGMILNTGPVSSGKTTTLYAALNALNTPSKNIITIEDPVEYCLDGISQIQVNSKTGLSFSVGLRSILRQDPNIIMVGEIRDKDTAEIAVRAALTGHLVFSTLHTNNAIGAIVRLLDMGIEPFLIASSILGVLAQRLVRKICPDCKEAYIVKENSPERKYLEDFYQPGSILYRGRGCESCGGTGYKERMAIQEVLLMNDDVRASFQNGISISLIKNSVYQAKMVPIYKDGIQKALAGHTSLAEVVRVTYGNL
jgi:type IV pilus assembly protein PilB